MSERECIAKTSSSGGTKRPISKASAAKAVEKREGIGDGEDKINDKEEVIAAAYTAVQSWTMVVEHTYTVVAAGAMFGAQWSFDQAGGAPLVSCIAL